MRKGFPVLLCIIFLSANCYAEEKMICYVPKKTVPKPIVPQKPVKKEPQEKSIANENNNSSSDLTSQSTQVLISYPPNACGKENTVVDKERNNWIYNAVKYFLEFVVKILAIVTWPIVLVVIVGKFKEEIKSLAERIDNANIAGVGVQFRRLADKYQDVDGEVTPDQEISSDIDPRGSIISAWLNIETKLYGMFENSNVISSGYGDKSFRFRPPVYKLIGYLKEKEIIGKNEVDILNDLRKMRNKVAHDADLKLSQDDVTQYLILANYVEARLDGADNQNS